MSDTPLTDVAEKDQANAIKRGVKLAPGGVSSSFARSMERELTEAQRQLAAHKEALEAAGEWISMVSVHHIRCSGSPCTCERASTLTAIAKCKEAA